MVARSSDLELNLGIQQVETTTPVEMGPKRERLQPEIRAAIRGARKDAERQGVSGAQLIQAQNRAASQVRATMNA